MSISKPVPRAAADCWEVKSQSKFEILILVVDIVEQARTYERCGAAMISVLQMRFLFKGHLDT